VRRRCEVLNPEYEVRQTVGCTRDFVCVFSCIIFYLACACLVTSLSDFCCAVCICLGAALAKVNYVLFFIEIKTSH